MTVWQRIWLIWSLILIFLVVMFLIVEGLALARAGIGDTLSESVWELREKGSWVYWVIIDAVMVTGITMAWLLFHFRFQSGRTP